MQEYREYKYYDDKPTWSHKYVSAIIFSMLDKNINKRIIDLGCGNGSLTTELINKGFDAYGIDASASGIEIAKESFPYRFFKCDLFQDELPEMLKNKTFDTIISTEVIEHLYDPRHFLLSCKKILNGEGELIITTPYHGYLKNLVISILNRWDEHHTTLWDGGHIKFWSKKTLSEMLNEFGFTIAEFKGAGRTSYLWKSMIIKARI